jgi:hypothetical protein
LERYEPLFRDNEIDWEVLLKLTSEDLKEIGVPLPWQQPKGRTLSGPADKPSDTDTIAWAVPA